MVDNRTQVIWRKGKTSIEVSATFEGVYIVSETLPNDPYDGTDVVIIPHEVIPLLIAFLQESFKRV